MIVYGDTITRENLCDKQAAVRQLLGEAAAAAIGIVRHQLLVAALIEAGELAQALLDARFAARGGIDDGDGLEQNLMAALAGIAGRVGRSWESGFAPAQSAFPEAALADIPLPEGRHEVRHPEGFAHYALYPEAYWAAARPFAPRADALVVGLRSIGTTLAATVAAALGTTDVATVRPTGHPFRRQVDLAAPLRSRWAARPARLHAVVDEGPGLSGSSFGAAADALEDLGVAPADIVFFPGHAGDLGAQASDAHRARWQACRRPVVSLADLAGADAPRHQRLDAWVADLTGPATAPLDDLSAGRWRGLLLADRRDWPPADAQNERVKVRMQTAEGAFLLRFAGLGRRGSGKYAMACDLARAGFGTEPLGWRHGFMIDRWLDGARPLRADRPPDRAAVLARLPAYLAFRASRSPADAGGGATLHQQREMARANITESLGDGPAARLDRWPAALLNGLAAAARPVRVDARLHPWEWLALPDGRVVKTDALDHHAAHDLIGAQDIAWDIAGARVEWGLSAAETAALADEVGRRTGRAVPPALLGFYGVAYPAFQLGAVAMAAARADPDEKSRFAAREALYRTAVVEALDASSTKL